jgi:hypothetical protein
VTADKEQNIATARAAIQVRETAGHAGYEGIDETCLGSRFFKTAGRVQDVIWGCRVDQMQ